MAVAELEPLGEPQRYPVASLLLDLENPRFRHPVDSQKAALREHLAMERDKIVNLARDIATQGAVNPTELPVIMEEDGHLVVIEGNRRLAALKLLLTPVLADGDASTFSSPRYDFRFSARRFDRDPPSPSAGGLKPPIGRPA